ncbi:MAG TPA: Rne/Rng family ribonuclease, partial [Propionibacteriaceae bacterium]
MAEPASETAPVMVVPQVADAAGEPAALDAPPVKKTAAKRPARKTAAKKTAAAEPASVDSGQGESSAVDESGSAAAQPKKRAPRKRATKKAADAPTETATDPTATDPTATDPAATDPVAVDAGAARSVTADTSAPAGWEERAEAAADAVEKAAQASERATPSSSATAEAPQDSLVQEDPTELSTSVDNEQQAAEAPPTTTTRDFGWLADPFAVPAQPETPVASVEPTDGVDPDSSPVPAEEAASETDAGSDDAGSDDPGADDPGADDADSSAEDDESGDGTNRRRRRRRGGRRRRRGGGDEDAVDSDGDGDDDSAPSTPAGEDTPTANAPAGAGADDSKDDTAEDSDEEDSEGQRRRRRRRRRRGEETAASPDDPTDVVVRVREPRSRKKAASTEVTGIEGSTRMEAKRQRRREGRDAGRRRAPILSEAEFLARRESVDRKMIIRQGADLAQIAVLEDGILVEHYVDRDSAASLIGNVFLGRVQNVLPSMEAAFIDIGRGRNAVLYAGEVDWDSFGAEGHNRKVEKVLKSGQMILVQVSKDPVGAKGARLTNHVSIPGRYVVYAPGGHLSGISRKLPDVERRRLKDILADLVGQSASVIVRTAAEGASEEELVRDVNRLKAQWEDIERKVKAGNSPQLLYGEPDLTVRIVRDLFTEDFSELVIQGNGSMNDAYDAIQGYVTHVAPHLQERIRRWEPTGDQDLFDEYRLDEQIAKALERKVFLPSGGSLVIDRTEAMTVIDVNTGKFTGTGGNLEATVTSNNLEAAEEIVNQLRLRDIGGIIVIDFIDM